MKKYFVNFCILSFAVFFLSGATEMPPAPAAVVTKVVNSAQYKPASGSWTTLKVGQALSTNDMVKTSGKALIVLKFTDNSVLKVRENSQVTISVTKNGKNVSKTVDIGKGTVNASVTKQDQQDFKVKSPTLVASVRGTEFLFGYDNDTTNVYLMEGKLFCEAQLGKKDTYELQEGMGCTVTSDGTIQAGEMTEKQKQEYNNSTKTNVRKVILKTPQGDLIIEYLTD
ncbi:MAG: FecR domain-containing protein [Ignavibacteriales bacterium]|nr:MAG: hypothetical protein F9K26_10475 [Ignavibacteriaceae bacterium]MBW7873619.1 FecR domain-containing protein [Ignavibacteria bacterium]MCZ2143849.1 FecR domain-containing protein [Ignavibacteriales bacterium]OQY71288.1 MAG: hypothetical protein B6D45_10235 [Ignavibacteriales bacterium UTCHB3]MBV6445880.1 hypothetical protein [Ignavibacteriaceae bacterium]